jgi:hypothetical protein
MPCMSANEPERARMPPLHHKREQKTPPSVTTKSGAAAGRSVPEPTL